MITVVGAAFPVSLITDSVVRAKAFDFSSREKPKLRIVRAGER